MVSKLDYRFWIIFFYYIILKCFLCNLFPHGVSAVNSYIKVPGVAKLNETKGILFIHASKLHENNDSVNERQQHVSSPLPLVDEKKAEKGYTLSPHTLRLKQTETDTTHKTNIYDNSDNNIGKTSSRIINENDMNSVSYTTDLYSNKFNYNVKHSNSHYNYGTHIMLTKDDRNEKVIKWNKNILKYNWDTTRNSYIKDSKKYAKVHNDKHSSNTRHMTSLNEHVQTNNKTRHKARLHHRQRRSTEIDITEPNLKLAPNKIKQTFLDIENNLSATEIDENTATILLTKKDNTNFNLSSSNKTKLEDSYKSSFDTKNTNNKNKANKSNNSRKENVLKNGQQKQITAANINVGNISGEEEILEQTGSTITTTSKYQHKNKSPRHIIDDDDFEEPHAFPLRPIIRGPFEDNPQNEVNIVYAEQRAPVKLGCEVDLDLVSSVWMKDGQIVHVVDKSSRSADFRFYREPRGSLTITNVMLEDDGIWQCEAENFRGYVENARPIRLIVLDSPKPPYLLIDSRRLDAGNIFVPVKENAEFSLACISEGGNPKPILSWEVLLSPAIERHAQKISTDVLELQEVKRDTDKDPFKITTGAISEARLPAVYRAHHNARILCVMEHPTLKVRQNASILLDVQYTPSFAITRTPGFGFPLREGIEVSLKCDVDSNPPSTPMWQKDDGDPPVLQNGDGYLNFTAIRKEHAGWYKCTSRHLNFQYSSIGYFLSVRSDAADVTSEPVEQESLMPSIHNPYKTNQMEVELGGSVTLQCPQGSLGCWSHFDPNTARLRGLGSGIYTPTGQFSLKDVVYSDAGSYKCIGQNVNNKKKLEIIKTVSVSVKGPPTVSAKNVTPIAFPGSPLHLTVEFCANPSAYAARWLHGDRIYHPGNQYGVDVLAYGFIDLPTPFCKEARLTYVHMHEKVPRQFFFIVSSPTGVSEIIFNVNFTLRSKKRSKQHNSVDEDEELMSPEEIHFPIFGSSALSIYYPINIYYYCKHYYYCTILSLLSCFYMMII